MVTVSVVIPTLNEEAVIGELLKRLKAQTYHPIEIIVVDGGSSDDTQKIVRSHPDVRIIASSSGVSAQRNAGGAASTSELIVFLDADNAPSPIFIESLANSYARRPFMIACPWFFPQSRRPDIHAFFGFMNVLFYLSQLRYHTGAGVCMVTPRRTFQRLGGFDETLHLGEDINYMRRAATFGAHRHLIIPLATSARRFEEMGLLRTAAFYARISPALLIGDNDALRKLDYPAIRQKSAQKQARE